MPTQDVPLFPTGAGIDNRTKEQKNKDWRPEEAFASGAPLQWREKTIEEVEAEIFATSISQGQTFRCVTEYAGIAFEMAEFLETGKRIVFSRRDIYVRRYNRPGAGMAMFDLFNLMRQGACYESQLPSTQTNEVEINKDDFEITPEMVEARSKHASASSFTWNTFTIDDLAGMIEQKTPVCLFVYFNNNTYDEWWNGTPKVTGSVDMFAPEAGRHQATGISYLLHNGKKCIAVMDSAGQGTGFGTQKNIRFVSEDFLKARCYGAGFAVDKKNLDYVPPTTIKYNFTRNLKNGMSGDDVKMLQKILVAEGCLVLQTPTNYFGGMTEAGVKKLQEKYASEILTPLGLKQGTGFFFNSTRSFINRKYA